MPWTANQGCGTGLTSRTIITADTAKGIGTVVERMQVAEPGRAPDTAAERAEVGGGMWAGSGSHLAVRVGERNCSHFLRDMASLV